MLAAITPTGRPVVPYRKNLTHPNGYNPQVCRLSFACFKQCTRSANPEHLELYRHCPHRANSVGFATHVPLLKFPRLILEIHRGSDSYKEVHGLRLARFVIDITRRQRKLKAAVIPFCPQHLAGPEVPAFIKPYRDIN